MDEKTTPGYLVWRMNQGKGQEIAPYKESKQLVVPYMESVQEEIRAQLESQNTSLNFEVEKLGPEKRKLVSNLMAQEKSLAKVEEKRDRLMTQLLQQQKKGFEIYKEQFTLLTIVKKKQTIKMVKMVEEASGAQKKIAGLEKINDALHKQCS